ncbi:MAG TPA: hypothetical protein VF749_18520 [Candidatus Acidoferrum sp.]
MSKNVKVVLASAILVLALAALTSSRHVSIVPRVLAEEVEVCSAQSLEGRYAFTGEGYFTSSTTTLPALIGAFAPAADVGVFVSDGQGTISGSDTLSSGGQTTPRTFTGTYKVNSDCTGTTALQFSPGPSTAIDIAIVLDDRGHEVRALQTNPQGAVFTVLARRVR